MYLMIHLVALGAACIRLPSEMADRGNAMLVADGVIRVAAWLFFDIWMLPRHCSGLPGLPGFARQSGKLQNFIFGHLWSSLVTCARRCPPSCLVRALGFVISNYVAAAARSESEC